METLLYLQPTASRNWQLGAKEIQQLTEMRASITVLPTAANKKKTKWK
jgi:hypothetical protein